VDARHPAAPRIRTFLALIPFLAAGALAGCSATGSPPSATSAPATSAPAASAPAPAPTTPPSPTPAPSATADPAAGFPVTLTDDDGTSVTIPAEPTRIVTLTPAATETLFALGVGDRLVGKAQDILLYPPRAAGVPDVEKFDGSAIVVDVERIVADKADLVIAGGNFGTPPDAVDKLRSLGVPVVVVYAPSVEGVYTDIELLGAAVGRPTAAAAMVATMRNAFDEVAAAVAGAPTPRVYYELDATDAFYAPSDQSFLAEMITDAGGDPITTGSPDKYAISAERLLAADPEVILLADTASGVTAGDVVARPGWGTMTAVKEGDIRPIDDTTISRPGPRLFLGLELLASTIHPALSIPASSPIPPVP
jgi:iron complex transport system substrate-binding protein